MTATELHRIMTTHQSAIRAWRTEKSMLADWSARHDHLPAWLRDKILAGKHRAAMRRAVKPSPRSNPRHAGRASDYLDECAMFSRALMPLVSVRGRALRALILAVRSRYFAWGYDAGATRCLDESDLSGMVGKIRSSGQYVSGRGSHVWTASWAAGFNPERAGEADYGHCKLIMDALADGCRMEIGRTRYVQMMARLNADPGAKIGGYLSESLMSMMRDPDSVAAYEGCSGGEMTTYIRLALTRDDWQRLLERAPVGAVTDTAIQCFPHEAAKTALCAAAGLFHVFRMNDSIYTGTPDQVAAVVAKLNAA